MVQKQVLETTNLRFFFFFKLLSPPLSKLRTGNFLDTLTQKGKWRHFKGNNSVRSTSKQHNYLGPIVQSVSIEISKRESQHGERALRWREHQDQLRLRPGSISPHLTLS